jgi:hypothetical protein
MVKSKLQAICTQIIWVFLLSAPTKLDGIMEIPNESSSNDSTAPELMLKL